MSTWARAANGDMLLPTVGSGQDAIETDPATCTKIAIESELQFVLGEWFLDTSKGFPWKSIWAQKNPNLVQLRQLFRKTILGIPPVVSLVDLALDFDRATRNFMYAWSAKIASGQTVSGP